MEAEERPRRRRAASAANDSPVAIRERLTGAAILVVVVVLVVPSLLTGRRPIVPEQEPSGASKTYEIDLGDNRESAPEDLRRPLPEPVEAQPATPRSIPTPMPKPAVPRIEATDTATGVRAAPTGLPAAAAAARLRQGPSPAAAPVVSTVAAPPPAQPSVAAPAPAPAAAAWAVQLGAFAGRDTASRLVAELRAKGYAAFMLELRRDGKVLYRVRVGPEPDRERAVSIAERLNREGYKASVAAHP